jgi:hypothetical protein
MPVVTGRETARAESFIAYSFACTTRTGA